MTASIIEPTGLIELVPPGDSGLRSEARDRAIELGLPSSKAEGWKYTSLKSLSGSGLSIAPEPDSVPALVNSYSANGDALLVVLNGRFRRDLSSDIPSGVTVGSSASRPELLERLDALDPVRSEGHPLVAWSAALHPDSLFIDIEAGADAGTIEVLCVDATTRGSIRQISLPRLTVSTGESARATIVESHVSDDDDASLVLASTRLDCGPNAELHHIRIQNQSLAATHFGVVRATLARDSRLRQFALTTGALVSRFESIAILKGEGSDCEMNGLYLIDGEQKADHQTLIDHAVPHCTSRENFKGILDGTSRGIFEGRVVVRQDAQKTNAAQSNDNLVLSDGAIANSTPQLEIYADDVKCRHGSTIGRLDTESIFYLRSRGIDAPTARAILTRGFASEVVDTIQSDPLRKRVEAMLSKRMQQ